MAQIPDLIRDSKLETYFLPDCTVETVHRFQESDSASGQRLVTRLEHWRRQRRVGNGGFGTVWLEECIKAGRPGGTQDGTVRAVKQIDMDTRFGSIEYNRELEAIAKFSHSRYERCFVKSFGWYEGPGQLFIAMEYLETGDLFAYLYQKPLPPLPEAEAKEIAYQILDGLCMMHENGFAHRDLKPNNILIKSHPPDKWWIKLADFGITKRIEESHGQSTTIKGTPRYFAPEIWGFAERGSAYAIDIWAVGEIVFEILTKKPAFATPGLLAGYKAKQDFPVIMLTDAGIRQPGVDFVLSLMCPRPNDRMTATSAISDAWIQSPMLQPLGSTKAIEGEPRVPSPATIMTDVSTSWTTRTYSEAPGDVSHDISSSTTTVELVNAARDKTIVPQENNLTLTLAFRAADFRSQHRAGDSFYRQKRYKEAEIEFRRVLQGREETLGYDHEDTLYSAHALGLSLHPQKCYEEAETVFRRALHGRDRVLVHNHEETLYSTYRLGLTLYHQEQYKVAAPMFRQAFLGREKTLGYDHRHTLCSAYWLGLSFYRQKRYKEAETMLRRTLQGREKTLGHDHEETVNARECMDRAHARALGLE
ncbi:Calcium/calmodulin-dependent protein kinase type [Penicillium chrysogenum]|uniref:Serine/threonine-protein kinase ATG1 n=2 Tax=Penicillium chrysogenum species complex TaxID=254878 RepID=B6H6Z6_PENRW|nr:Calcium/calmodulin-dependent protein kinase type [Penicillium chrysogenum]CAP92761.1 Pc16g00910 [Penicillium rubens Wisconsin 54-1255]